VKTFILIFGITICAFCFYACSKKCDEEATIKCDGLSKKFADMVNYEINDTIKFGNEKGNKKRFIVNYKKNTEAHNEYICHRDRYTCECEEVCDEQGAFVSEGDSIYQIYNGYSVYVFEETFHGKGNYSTYRLDVLGFKRDLNLVNNSVWWEPTDSLISSLQLGSKTYYNVYEQMLDTTLAANQNKPVWKVYFTTADGLIGFNERFFNSSFVREY